MKSMVLLWRVVVVSVWLVRCVGVVERVRNPKKEEEVEEERRRRR
jgi:hypothetical protein